LKSLTWPQRPVLWSAVGLLPALSLSLPSGYSIGALLLVAIGVHHIIWRNQQPAEWNTSLRAFAWCTAAMGVLWALDMLWREPFQTNGMDRPLKYALALLAIPALLRGLPSLASLKWGIWLGAWSAAGTAAWQIHVLHWDRAWGYTNAIAFGDLALLLGIWSWVWARTSEHPASVWFGRGAALAGLYACMASGSRGAWLVAPVLVVLVLWLGHRQPESERGALRSWQLSVALAAALAVTAVLWQMQPRIEQASQEVQQYQQAQNSETSVGQRLAHWELAWAMGLERPWLGWGQIAYDHEKLRRVEAGEIPRVLLRFGHAHHEWLDMWVKKGLLGVLVLASFLWVPGWYYAAALRQWRGQPEGGARAAAALCGMITVVGFIGFGMTQVMLAHNSSTVMYLFMNLIWLAALLPALYPPATGQHAQH